MTGARAFIGSPSEVHKRGNVSREHRPHNSRRKKTASVLIRPRRLAVLGAHVERVSVLMLARTGEQTPDPISSRSLPTTGQTTRTAVTFQWRPEPGGQPSRP